MRSDASNHAFQASRDSRATVASRIAHTQMRRDATARTVLSLLAITGVVVSAIVAKQATVSRQAAFASPPMLDVQTLASSTRGTRATLQREARPTSTQPTNTQPTKATTAPSDSTHAAIIWPERLSPSSPNFVGPRVVGPLAIAPLAAPQSTDALPNTTPANDAAPNDAAAGNESTPPTIDLDSSVRWFHGRPVKPARVLWMRVTAYSPDERSCPGTADGFTSTMHCVTTNNGLLVAADPTVLPMGSMLSVPGYGKLATGEEAIVPVLDVGSAIKGERLDLLFSTHEEAMKWGVRELPVVIWQYVDGKPFANPRQAR
jgi:3D (Asp-Asp-Asp) domain-containing protein